MMWVKSFVIPKHINYVMTALDTLDAIYDSHFENLTWSSIFKSTKWLEALLDIGTDVNESDTTSLGLKIRPGEVACIFWKSLAFVAISNAHKSFCKATSLAKLIPYHSLVKTQHKIFVSHKEFKRILVYLFSLNVDHLHIVWLWLKHQRNGHMSLYYPQETLYLLSS